MGQLVLGYLFAHGQQSQLALLRVDYDQLPVDRRQPAQQVNRPPPYTAETLQQLGHGLGNVGFVGGVDGSPNRQLPLSIEVGTTEERVDHRAGVRQVSYHLLQGWEGGRMAIAQAGFVKS